MATKAVENNRTRPLPMQRLTYKEKIADDYDYFKRTASYYINSSVFNAVSESGFGYKENNDTKVNDEIGLLIGLYNNDVPSHWFSHITKPIGDKEFLPAKVRPFNILKTNIDYLISVFGKRALSYTVINEGEKAYNQFVEEKKKYKDTLIRQRYVQVLQGKQVDGTPEELLDQFDLKYTDALAYKAQAFLDKVVSKYDIPEKLSELFLQYCIYGEPVSLRTIVNDKLVYEVKDSRDISHGYTKTGYIEDAEWAVEFHRMSISDFSDQYYGILDKELWKSFDEKVNSNGVSVRQYLQRGTADQSGYVDVYKTVWKGLKKIKMVYGLDGNGQPFEREEDESYEESKDEYVEEKWIPQIFRTDKINNDFYLNMGEYPYAISSANAINENKLPYNGISYAYKSKKIFSILKAGISYLTLYLICHLTIEKMLAKHKGKIFLIDYNVVPKIDGWDEKKFIQYMEAMGYAFINRNQLGVDKSFNQYQSIDMSMIGDIFQLKNLADSYVDDWDRMTGITRQAKGQAMASDQVGTTRSAIQQSNITIDYIFQKFGHFVRRELQAILELSKFMTLGGYNDVIDKDEYGSELLSIFPGELLERLGIKVSDSSQDMDNLNKAKQYLETVNQQDPELVLDGIIVNNIAQLKGVLNKMARKAAKAAQQNQDFALQQSQAVADAQKELEEFKNQLLIERDNNKFTNDSELLVLQGEIDASNVPTPDVVVPEQKGNLIDYEGLLDKSRDRVQKDRQQDKDLQFKYNELAAKERMNQDNNKTALKNKVSGQK